jgi:small subunit ribosomal protein S23e
MPCITDMLLWHASMHRWADKGYNKSHLGSEWKKPFAGASHSKGIVLEKM